MVDLIAGKEVDIPFFDFGSKSRGGYKKLKVTNDNPIIIEGIHALNNLLTEMIPKEQKFKIFIKKIIANNMNYIFEMLIKHKYNHWINIKKYRYRGYKYSNYIQYLEQLCIQMESTPDR